jgi:hypothetical protein
MEDNTNIFNFTMNVYDRQILLLKKYKFTDELELDAKEVDIDDVWVFSELIHAGLILKMTNYYRTTIFGNQLLKKIK